MKREREREAKRTPETPEESADGYADRLFVDPELDKFLDEFGKSLKIDKTDLDTECTEQPELYYEVSNKLAILISRRDAAKQYKDVVEAEVDAMIRHAAAERDEKVTAKEADAKVSAHSRVKKANFDLMRLNHQVNRLGALKEAFGQRQWALKDLVQLYIANYYSDSTTGRASHAIRDHTVEEVRRKAADERRRRM